MTTLTFPSQIAQAQALERRIALALYGYLMWRVRQRLQSSPLRMAGSDWRKPTARRMTVNAGCRRGDL